MFLTVLVHKNEKNSITVSTFNDSNRNDFNDLVTNILVYNDLKSISKSVL